MTYALLEGLRVLELGQFLSAPYCGKLLADMGAEVIKIEPPGAGDHARQYGPFLADDPHPERSGFFLYLNANKRGVTLDLGTPTGQGILRELVSRSEVLVHNLHPLEVDRMNLDYGTISRANSSLVMASITPFGLTGPYRDHQAYDINLAAAGGICEGLGEAGREPLTFGTPQVGYFAGLAAASSIVMALLALAPVPGSAETAGPPFGKGGVGGISSNTGEGQHIDIAEVETLAGIYNGPEALMAVYQWRMTQRTGHHALDFPYPNCILRCKDGYIFAGAPEGRQWGKLLELMGNPEWSKEPRFRNRTDMNNLYADEVDGYVEAWLMDRTKAELLELALEHRVPLAPVRGYDEVRHDESLAGLFVDIGRADTGPLPYPGPPYVLNDTPQSAPSPAPFLGQHNQDVYCGTLGFTGEQLVKLYQTGII
ncbi:MAG: CoA transferase [Dehalococcoidia bacterium]|nr:CoA transferase [Dehalococcoidia bacterium]